LKNLYQLSATELSQLTTSKSVAVSEVVQAHLDRIDELNPEINAVTLTMKDSALLAAERADALKDVGPLYGVPFTVKENIDVLGTATSQGVTALKNAMPSQNAPIVSRLIAAGAIPIARTNLPEFALRLCTDNPLYGATQNPWNQYLTPGGSSGGDAAAVATGMAPLGIGNDTGGSLRSPAYCCGVAALKPTTGRVPTVRSIEPKDFGLAMQLMQVDGPMARSISDLRLALGVMAGRDIGDPRSVDVALIGSTVKKKVGMIIEVPGVEVPEITLTEIHRAANILTDAGYEVTPVMLPELDAVNRLWEQLFTKDIDSMLRDIQPILSRPVHLFLADMCRANDVSISHSQLMTQRARLSRRWSQFFADYPAVICPNWTQLPWPVDADLEPYAGLTLLHNTTPCITPANALGFPAVALPMGVSNGLPTGIQICADLWREDLCLDIAAIIEAQVSMPTPIDPVF